MSSSRSTVTAPTCPRSGGRLVAEASEGIDLLGYALRFLFEGDPRLAGLLAEKANEGCQVRIALIDPECAEARRAR